MPVLPGDDLPSRYQPPAPSGAPGGGSSPIYSMPYASNSGGNFYYHPSGGIGTMTGVWGDSRGGGSRLHQGQDIRMPMNTPMIAVTSGIIQHYQNSSAGTVVYLKGDDGNKYSYFHLNKRIAKHGQRVQGGQVIALSGNTGNSSGPHLHFETWIGGRKVDPRLFLSHTKTPAGSSGKLGSGNFPTIDNVTSQLGKDPNDPINFDFFQDDQFKADIERIFGSIDMTPVQDTTYGAWADQLRDFQQQLADRGLAEAPRKIKAKNLLHASLRSMSEMVKTNGYGSSLPSSTPGGVSNEGSNVVSGAQEGSTNVVQAEQEPTPR